LGFVHFVLRVEGIAVLGEGSDGVGEGSDEGSALQRLTLSQARLDCS
jgi:hypothetical protein